MKDYTGTKVYLGIDAHKTTYSVTAICEGQIVKRDTMAACPQKLAEYCLKHFKGAIITSGYEAGFCGHDLHRVLVKHGIQNLVIHPSALETAARNRVKTDLRDSEKIAVQLAAGRLKSNYIPSLQQEQFRSITRLRELLVRDKRRVATQLKSYLNYMGLSNYKDTKRSSRKRMLDILALTPDSEPVFYLRMLAQRWLDLHEHIQTTNSRLKEQASTQLDLEKIYRSVPGIGPTVSRILINELGDMSQFKSERALFSFTGLTPQEYSSGEHIRKGHISRQGRAILRRILVQAAWTGIRHDNNLKQVFERISQKAGNKRAIIAVARRLIGHIRACLRKNEQYSYNKSTALAL